jgi:hypothetical protein
MEINQSLKNLNACYSNFLWVVDFVHYQTTRPQVARNILIQKEKQGEKINCG